MFGSNLKSVAKNSPEIDVDFNSYSDYLNYGVVSSPKTIFRNIFKLQPGELLEIDLKKDFSNYNKEKFWNPIDYLDDQKFSEDKFLEILNSAVKYRKESDVEFAALASGGIDSSLIINILSKNEEKINTFSIGFDDKDYDESIGSIK